MENSALAMPLFDLFGEQVVTQRRTFGPRPRRSTAAKVIQLGLLDIIEMSEAELERLRGEDEVTDEYVQWLREYLLKLTLRQLVHPQSSNETRMDALLWIQSDDNHPFSFRACCNAWTEAHLDRGADHEDVRDGVLWICRKLQTKLKL